MEIGSKIVRRFDQDRLAKFNYILSSNFHIRKFKKFTYARRGIYYSYIISYRYSSSYCCWNTSQYKELGPAVFLKLKKKKFLITCKVRYFSNFGPDLLIDFLPHIPPRHN